MEHRQGKRLSGVLAIKDNFLDTLRAIRSNLQLEPLTLVPRRCSMVRLLMPAVALFLVTAPAARCQDSDEVKRLKERIELLETKMKVLELQNEKLQKENDQLRSKAPPAAGMKRSSLSDMLPEGSVLLGNFRNLSSSETGTITLTITERDGLKVKAKWVAKAAKNNEPYPERTMEGYINGSQMTLQTVASAERRSVTVTLKNGSIEGTQVLHESGVRVSVAFPIPK